MMMICLIILSVLLAAALAALGVLLVLRGQNAGKENSARIILKGGRSVNTEVIRENMGNGILNEHAEEELRTVVVGTSAGCGRHILKLEDCETGYVYQAVFENELMIGSQAEAGVPWLVIGLTGISRLHCRIWRQEGRYVIEDCRSTNHTWLNGFLLEKPFLLHNGDVLQLAGRRFRVEVFAE